MIQRVTPFLWYQEKPVEAARFYVSILKNSKIIEANPMMATFDLEGGLSAKIYALQWKMVQGGDGKIPCLNEWFRQTPFTSQSV